MPAVSSDILWSNLEKCFHHYNNYIYIYIVATNVIVFFVLLGEKTEITYASVVVKSRNVHDSEGKSHFSVL